MGVFSDYSLPIQGLKPGIHTYRYELDGSFFKKFESSPIGECEIIVDLELDVRPSMLVLDFFLEGWTQAACDRCSADIRLPLENDQTLFVKFNGEEDEEEEDDDVLFIHRESPDFNVAQHIYEFAVLSLPLTNIYNCEDEETPPCNQEVLQILKDKLAEGEKQQDQDNPFRDVLKNWKEEK